jgi:hypothetical protein
MVILILTCVLNMIIVFVVTKNSSNNISFKDTKFKYLNYKKSSPIPTQKNIIKNDRYYNLFYK